MHLIKKSQLVIQLWLGIIFLTYCTTQEKREKVDLLVINGNIYTVDDSLPQVEAMAIKAGKIIALGTTKEMQALYEAQETVNAQKKAIYPGFIDAHCHFYGLGLNQQRVNLIGTQSYEEVIAKVVAFQKEKQTTFILGRGWDQNDWEVKVFPTKARLDSLFPDIPVVLERVDGHAYLVNQKALTLAGITAATKVTGGKIELKAGVPTGILIDEPMQLIDAIIPAPSTATQITALKEAEAICLANGLTTVNDAGLSRATIELIDSLQQADQLRIRMYAMVSNTPEEVDYFLKKGIIKTDRLHVRSVKVYADGALGSRGATLKAPYSDKKGHFGAMITAPEAIEQLAEKIARSDYQMNTHAIGDSANSVVLRTYAKVLKNQPDRRWKIEHAQVVDPKDLSYFSNNILPSVQPTHATSDMHWVEERVGEKRLVGAYAYKSLLKEAGLVALGTDFPVEEVSPLLTFYAAVARKNLDNYPEDGFRAEEALSRAEALKGMTLWAAYSNFEEAEKGSLAIGKKADFVILGKDIMTIPLEEIPTVKVLKTYLDGQVLYGD